MKNIHLILLAAFCWMATPTTSSAAHFSVTDFTLIRTNIINAKKDLLEQIRQETNQQTQINQLLAQIRQADDLLKRMGKLDEVKDLPGFAKEAHAFLRELERNLPSFEIIRNIKKDELFEKKQGYDVITKDIIIDGKKVGEVDGGAVTPELAARRVISHYHKVRSEVLQKRAQLKGDLELAMQRLNAATTTAEVDKLTAVISALNIQIQATDADLVFASNEVASRYYQNKVEEDIRQKVEVQKSRAQLKEGMKNHFKFFRLPSRPALFNPQP